MTRGGPRKTAQHFGARGASKSPAPAFAFYNAQEEIDALERALRKILEAFR